MQLELPWALGPADGRYVVRDAPGLAASHVLVLATLGAPERRRLRRRRARAVAPEPLPTPVTTARATVVDAAPVSRAEAEEWLTAAGAADAEAALALVARAVRAHRIATADPAVPEPALAHALVVRVGYGGGEQVAAGRWSAARELPPGPTPRRRRSAGLRPQERIAALLGAHLRPLACEELTLRARHDLDTGQLREAALQLQAALEAALAELPSADGAAADMPARVDELRERAPAVAALADAALAGELPPTTDETLAAVLQRLEAALRAHIASVS